MTLHLQGHLIPNQTTLFTQNTSNHVISTSKTFNAIGLCLQEPKSLPIYLTSDTVFTIHSTGGNIILNTLLAARDTQ